MKTRGVVTGAGGSAQAGYREARAGQRRRRAATMGLVVVAAALLFAGVHTRSWWPLALTLAAAFAGWRMWPRDDPERWLRGAAGERATGAILAGLPRHWVVLHDLALPRSRANVDHLVIGRSGVWVIDTKTYRAPLSVRRGRVWAGDYAVPTEAAVWEADQVSDLLEIEVNPIVAVHGQGLRSRGKRCQGVRIIPADRLVRRLRRRGRRLSRAEVAEIARRATVLLPAYPPLG